MPFLQSSGAIAINDIKNLFGGPTSPALSNYYRGGSYIPSSKTVTVSTRSPSSGEYYVQCCGTSRQFWYFYNGTGSSSTGQTQIYAPSLGVQINLGSGTNVTTYTTGNRTYYRGSLGANGYDSYYGEYWWYYRFYWIDSSTSTTNINTGIPTSGQVSISQFYGAEKP